MTQVADDPLDAGREAAARGAYADAYELLSRAASPEAGDLERLADAAYWTGRLDEALELRERTYAAYLKADEVDHAARVALGISGDYLNKAAISIASGWFAKAKRLVGERDDSPVRGHLAFIQGALSLFEGNIEHTLAQLDEALDTAKTLGDRNLLAMALVVKGRTLVMKGEAEEGLALLDEATASAVSGELEPFATGFVYCCTITSCHGVGDYRRASQWTEAAKRWCERSDITGFPGACRVHHASIQRLRGDWSDAEEQATRACEELGGFDAWTTAAGFYEIGEIRRRRGEFALAEESYAQAKEWGREPEPGLSLLRLAQGKTDAAVQTMRRSLTRTSDPVGRIRRLPAQVEIALAAGNFKEARDAAAELEETVDHFRVGLERTPAFEATVCLAWGQIRLLENDLEGAVAQLERAVTTWRDVGAPYEVAQAQLLLGKALRKLGEEESARDEIRAAERTFEKLGAALDLQATKELLGESEARRTFMFTDIVDSTKLVEALGESRWQKVLAWHDRELREHIEEEGGEVIKQTGDGYFAAFDSSACALRAAVAIQRSIDAREGIAPDVRIGIHSGGAFHRSEDDYAGQGVNVTARIGALAEGGEILVSRESVDGSPFPLSTSRTEELKGIEQPVELVAVEWR